MLRRIKKIEEVIEKAYEKSCQGDWSALNDIKILDRIGGFWVRQVTLETIAQNLKGYYKEPNEDTEDD